MTFYKRSYKGLDAIEKSIEDAFTYRYKVQCFLTVLV